MPGDEVEAGPVELGVGLAVGQTTGNVPQLLLSHPAEVKVAHAPLVTLPTELMTQAPDEEGTHPLNADEAWDFCAWGFAKPSADHKRQRQGG